MSGQKGRDVLIKISDGGAPEAFTTVAGIRTSSFDLKQKSVDATSMDSPGGWRELLGGAGLRSMRVRGRGLFKDAASDARLRAVFLSGELCGFKLCVPDFGDFTGPFQIAQLGWAGTFDGEATFSIDLRSAGQVTFEESA
ncbi:phage major tail protein, TP901-1 family [Henriciella barbarensis]|uniref:Phage major tail protein, TP901-1 family n=1 Tax=Henriciella barbarensis TaxID=86342 RepID=A0A399QN63_9PROT|nr:phage major tail protein, TP901-1 family [Henriciella barbarensis]RIJ20386.1 phage major tail protein, TP901-1 family [Henriciella barbarensis]